MKTHRWQTHSPSGTSASPRGGLLGGVCDESEVVMKVKLW